MVFVELCCGRNSCLRQACMEVGVSYIGCHDCLQEKAVQREIIELISSVVRDAGSSQRPTVDLSAEPRFMFMFLYRVLEAVRF